MNGASMKRALLRTADVAGLPFLDPLVRLCARENPRAQLRKLFHTAGVPLIAFGIFLLLWTLTARSVRTSYGTLPTPAEVWVQAGHLWGDHVRAREAAREFRLLQEEKAALLASAADEARAAAGLAEGPEKARLLDRAGMLAKRAESARSAPYAAAPTYPDQIFTSLKTVFTGFLLASLVAVPLGILCGLSSSFQAAMNPMIQIFKPVSPLAWLPIVMIVVGATAASDPATAWFEKSFLTSAVTVALCSLWPTVINTALGVSSIDRNHLAVARVLRLGWAKRLRKIVLPSALPLIFAGLRLSLGVGWMVLIAAEMLAQNPGLGKFVWDMFQNGSRETLAQIMVAVFTIGGIGFLLDRGMVLLQRSVSYRGAPA
jgi:nitrate/nitrite transport system permease protein